MLLVERVGLKLRLVRAGMRCVWAPTFGLEGVDCGMVLGRVLRRQGRALQPSLEADAAPEDIERTHTFDGAESTQRTSNKVGRQSGEEHACSRSHRLSEVRLHLLWFGLEGEQWGRQGGEVRSEGHIDGKDRRLVGLQRRGGEKNKHKVMGGEVIGVTLCAAPLKIESHE